MRKGQNPAKMGLLAYRPSQLGILLVVYIPLQSEYFFDSLKILKYQLASIHQNTPEEYNLHVFDNGSCREVKDALHKLYIDGWIDWLTLSQQNLGKAGVLNWALRGMPNEIICYSDGDVYFRPDWYGTSLKILKTFPETGMVTSQPCFFDSLRGMGRAHFALRENQNFEFSTRIADSSIAEEYVRSIGNSPDLMARYAQHSWEIVCNKATGVEAVIGSSPFQFMGYKTALEKILPLPSTHGLNKDDDTQITVRMDELGLLQLSTLKPYVYHMGNQVDETTLGEIQRDCVEDVLNNDLAVSVRSVRYQITPAKKTVLWLIHQMARVPFLKLLVQRFYNLLFEYYAREK
ncbi:MAG TPA: glycosyltransferase family A protein [Anaerolineales bacterium]